MAKPASDAQMMTMTSDASVMVTVFASACQYFIFLAVFERAEHQIVDRHQHDDRAQSEHKLFDKRVEFLLFFHQKISSLLRSTTS